MNHAFATTITAVTIASVSLGGGLTEPRSAAGKGVFADLPYAGLKAVLIAGADKGGPFPEDLPEIHAMAESLRKRGFEVRELQAPLKWATVRDAMQGASVVGYWGHGVIRGHNGNELESYNVGGLHVGEGGSPDEIAREVRLAPGAAVMLFHACFTAGNSGGDGGKVRPEIARMRVSTYSEAFFKAGASVYFAGHTDRFLNGWLDGKPASEAFMGFTNGATGILNWDHSFRQVPIRIGHRKTDGAYPDFGPAVAGKIDTDAHDLRALAVKKRQTAVRWGADIRWQPGEWPDELREKVRGTLAALPAQIADQTNGKCALDYNSTENDLVIELHRGEEASAKVIVGTEFEPVKLAVTLTDAQAEVMLSGTKNPLVAAWPRVVSGYLEKIGYQSQAIDWSEQWAYGYRPSTVGELEKVVQPLSPAPGAPVGGAIKFSWAGEKEGAYELIVQSEGKEQVFAVTGCETTVPIGTMATGKPFRWSVRKVGGKVGVFRHNTFVRLDPPRFISVMRLEPGMQFGAADVSPVVAGKGGDVLFQTVIETAEDARPMIEVTLYDGSSFSVEMKEIKRSGNRRTFQARVTFGANRKGFAVRHRATVSLTASMGRYQSMDRFTIEQGGATIDRPRIGKN